MTYNRDHAKISTNFLYSVQNAILLHHLTDLYTLYKSLQDVFVGIPRILEAQGKHLLCLSTF